LALNTSGPLVAVHVVVKVVGGGGGGGVTIVVHAPEGAEIGDTTGVQQVGDAAEVNVVVCFQLPVVPAGHAMVALELAGCGGHVGGGTGMVTGVDPPVMVTDVDVTVTVSGAGWIVV
jgi:hypothetical protein